MGTILLIILILLLVGALPSWPYSSGWVLSEWRPGTGAADYYHPVSGGPAVSAAAPRNLFIKFASHSPGSLGTRIYPIELV